MEYKSGTFALYQGHEYRLSMEPGSGNSLLVSKDPASSQNGFVPWSGFPGKFIKKVQENQLEYVYTYKTIAVYRGRTFPVQQILNGQVHLFDSGFGDTTEIENLGFVYIDRGWFRKIVPIEDMEEIRVITEPMLGFPLPPGHQGE